MRGALVWSDEIDGEAGTLPDPHWWRHETGGDGRTGVRAPPGFDAFRAGEPLLNAALRKGG